MRIDLDVDVAPLILRLRNGERRLAYAAVNAINATAKRVQLAEIENVREHFTIRKPTFFFGTPARPGGVAARIRPFASVKQGRAYAEIAVQAPASRGAVARQTLLPMFEAGGKRPTFTPGAKQVAVPLVGGPARPQQAESVPRAFTFSALHFERSSSGKQFRGRQRTFIVNRAGGGGAVLQRTGPGAEDVRTVYTFQPPPTLDRRLRWMATAQRVADVWFREEMEREAVKAVQFARGQGL